MDDILKVILTRLLLVLLGVILIVSTVSIIQSKIALISEETTTFEITETEVSTGKVIEGIEIPKEELTTLITDTTTNYVEPTVQDDSHPVAAAIWNYLRARGYTRAICAGILGNIMTDLGGQSLNINPYEKNGDYYGICQWSVEEYPELLGKDLFEQLDFLMKDIEQQINKNGSLFHQDFNYSAFSSIRDAGTAARAFAICYRQAESWTCSVRENNAYSVFTHYN